MCSFFALIFIPLFCISFSILFPFLFFALPPFSHILPIFVSSFFLLACFLLSLLISILLFLYSFPLFIPFILTFLSSVFLSSVHCTLSSLFLLFPSLRIFPLFHPFLFSPPFPFSIPLSLAFSLLPPGLCSPFIFPLCFLLLFFYISTLFLITFSCFPLCFSLFYLLLK